MTTMVSEIEPFTETKYVLGIPIVDSISLPLTPTTAVVEDIKVTLTEKTSEIKQEFDDLPPKPPPRTFGVVDLNKPAYPIDSPKPNISEKLKGDLPPKSTIFEFPETRNTYTVESTVLRPPESPSLLKESKIQAKYFEPKMASTPKIKPESSEYEGHKSIPSFDVQKNLSESKISPTNSIVRAMIYSNKNKAGKKKNTITASE